MLVDSRKLGVFRRRCMRSSYCNVVLHCCDDLRSSPICDAHSRLSSSQIHTESYRQVHLLDFPRLPRSSGDDGLVDFNLAVGIICAPGEDVVVSAGAGQPMPFNTSVPAHY